ncbi:PGF-pre-PGF domain-containing protein [Methanosarcina sp. T3]|uniref:PGF-pre-PGF domain-containing protein n=1 Tax=Methanosarcina sp. T3 TaxID=3439062 RepID=UPI003F83A2B6
MSKVIWCLSVVFLVFVVLSGTLNSCISDIQRASAAELIQGENNSGNSSISTDTGRQGYSGEPLSPAQEKLSSDLLQLSDEHYLSGKESAETLRARMVELGQLRQEDPVSGRATPSGENPEIAAGSGGNASKASSYPDEKVYVYVYLEPFANSSILDGYCEIEDRDEENYIAVAWVPLESLETLAALSEVRNIQTVLPPFVRQGNTVTEGDSILNASSLRELYGVNGTGMKIGIISDGVDKLRDVQVTGDLPSDVHVLSNSVGGNEGTNMLEIVYDIAPGAELYFHDCGNNRLEFNRAVDALVDEGCTVICDDIGWLAEPFFEDGIVADHVKEVIKENDLLYVSSAGNSGNSHYQGFFYDNGNGWHDFSRGQGEVENLRLVIPPSGKVWIFLQWDDRWEHSGNNYDLFIKGGNTLETIASSEVYQDGDNLPLEYIMYTNSGKNTLNASIEVRKTSGEARELELYIYYWTGTTLRAANIVSKDSIFGHPALPEVITVGAVGTRESGDYYIEYFSSVGPVTLYYPSPEIRPKTDISGLDGVNVTGTDGVSEQFYGTSASCPHVAAIAALVWSAAPEKSAMDIKRLLSTSSTDLGEPGYDNVFGYGLVDALRMYEQASADPSTFTVKTDGKGDFPSISDAINSSRPGDTILVYPGTYRENVDVRWALNISSASGKPEDTVLKAENSGEPVIHVTANAAKISGFGISGSGETGGSGGNGGAGGAGISLESAVTCTLANNKISGCSPGVLLEESSGNTLTGNKISNNAEGLRLTDSSRNTILGNEFENSVNINESSSGETGLSNTWNTAAEIRYLYNGGIYESRFGNFYSDYKGQDSDGSGIGDAPYGSDSAPLIARLAAYSRGFEVGSAAPAQNVVSIDGNTLEFGIKSTRNCTFRWLLNGALLQTNEFAPSAVLSINTGELAGGTTESNTSTPVRVKYTLTVTATNGSSTLQHSWTLTTFSAEEETDTSENTNEDSVIRNSSSGGGSSKSSGDGSSGGSGGGGAGGSPEPASNVESKELVQSFVTSGRHILFDFSRNATPVTAVEFDSRKNAGKVTVIVEMLKNQSVLVSGLPEGEVYRHFNIWAGNSGFASPENIQNPSVSFRVEKDWISEKRIEPASVSLYRYSDSNWTELPSRITGEDEAFFYFESETPGFATFAVAGQQSGFLQSSSHAPVKNNSPETGPDGAPEVWITREYSDNSTEEGSENGSEDDRSIPAPGFVICIALLLAGALWSKKQ